MLSSAGQSSEVWKPLCIWCIQQLPLKPPNQHSLTPESLVWPVGHPSFIGSASLESPESKRAALPGQTEILPRGHWFRARGSFLVTDFVVWLMKKFGIQFSLLLKPLAGMGHRELGCACPSWEFGTFVWMDGTEREKWQMFLTVVCENFQGVIKLW